MNAADLAKLEGYVSHLEKKAAEEDKNGEYVDEIATCLKARGRPSSLRGSCPGLPKMAEVHGQSHRVPEKNPVSDIILLP